MSWKDFCFLKLHISNKESKIKDALAELKSRAKKCLFPPSNPIPRQSVQLF